MVFSKENVAISALIDKGTKELLDNYAKEIDLTLSRFARNLIYISLDDFKILKKIGCIKIAKTFRDQLSKIPAYDKKIKSRMEEEEKDFTTISIVIDQDTKELLEKYASDLGLSMKIFARNLIYVGLDEFKLLRGMGIIRLAFGFKKFLDSFENYEKEASGSQSNPL